jgi:hypothetical protein
MIILSRILYHIPLFALFFLISLSGYTQLTQTVRGKVTDKVTTSPLPGVNVILSESSSPTGTSTNAEGQFTLENIPTGRNAFMFTCIGYEPVVLKNVEIRSGKELVLEIEMTEEVTELDEITVRAYKKGEVLNKMATISARSFSMEESEHYAGSWSDPARMATNFAGVLPSSNDTRNDIIIRGNSPNGLLWRLEGIDIPNPNHFAVQGTSGGPISMLNSNLLSRSDFFTGAFPAQYGNAIAGVFDLNLRNGNNKKHEFILQAGLNGYEAGIEGPLAKNYNGSYMLNLRYSFLDVLQDLGFNIAGGAVPTYSDLNFKCYMPSKKAGIFTLFGLGGIDKVFAEAEKSTDQFNPITNTDLTNHTSLGIVGFTHKIILGGKANIRTALSFSAQQTHIKLDSIYPDHSKELYYSSNFVEKQYAVSTHYTLKVNSKNTLSTGVILKNKGINQVDSAMYQGKYLNLIDLDKEHLNLLQVFAEWKHRFTNQTDIYFGLHSQYLFLNETYTLEPRFGFSWEFTPSQSLRFGYGVHGQTQSLPVYFVETTNKERSAYWRTCEHLDFTKAHHFITGYENKVTDNWHVKIEAYYQDLWDIPVESKSSDFSVINLGATYYNGTQDKDSLVNEGLGRNYGLELTLERYLSNNWYFLTTASLFKSLYRASDKVWRNTVFSSNYAANALLGFEYPIGKRTSLDFNFRLVWSGGIRSLYVDKEASLAAGVIIYDAQKAYSERYRDYFKMDYKMTFTYNLRKATLDLALDIANLTDRDNIFSESFDPKTGETTYTYQQGFLPTALIRITF